MALSRFIRERVRLLVDRVASGYDSEWDGRNMVAVFDDDASEARLDLGWLLEDHCDQLVLLEGGYFEPGDYLAAVWQDLPVTAGSTDQDLDVLVAELVEEARGISCVVEQDLTLRCLQRLRSDYHLDDALTTED